MKSYSAPDFYFYFYSYFYSSSSENTFSIVFVLFLQKSQHSVLDRPWQNFSQRCSISHPFRQPTLDGRFCMQTKNGRKQSVAASALTVLYSTLLSLLYYGGGEVGIEPFEDSIGLICRFATVPYQVYSTYIYVYLYTHMQDQIAGQ